MINLMTCDASKFDYVLAYIVDIWRGPLEACVFGYFIYHEIGYFGFIGIGLIISFIPVEGKNREDAHILEIQCELW